MENTKERQIVSKSNDAVRHVDEPVHAAAHRPQERPTLCYVSPTLIIHYLDIHLEMSYFCTK